MSFDDTNDYIQNKIRFNFKGFHFATYDAESEFIFGEKSREGRKIS